MSNRNFADQIVTRDMSEFSKIYIVPLSDFHIGAPAVAVDVIRGYVEWIRQHPEAICILNGDLMDCATKVSVPELFDDLMTPDNAYKFVKQLLKPIKDKILMITRGNHEEMIWKQVGCDYMDRLAGDLGGIPYKPDGGMFGIRLGKNGKDGHRRMLWGYATHGWGGARTVGAKANKIEELTKAVGVQLYILSHDHTQIIHRLNKKVPPRSGISFTHPIYMRTERTMLCNSGGFVEYEGYVRRKGYAPQDAGTPRIRVELKVTRVNKEGCYLDIHASI